MDSTHNKHSTQQHLQNKAINTTISQNLCGIGSVSSGLVLLLFEISLVFDLYSLPLPTCCSFPCVSRSTVLALALQRLCLSLPCSLNAPFTHDTLKTTCCFLSYVLFLFAFSSQFARHFTRSCTFLRAL